MWKMLNKPKTILVTRDVALEFAEMTAPPHDRPLSERRLNVYRKMLKAGGFRPVTWATCRCEETGDTYRINGKHTSTLLSTCDPMPEFYAIIETYRADTLQDVAQLYSTFDSRMQLRSAGDINRSFAGSVPELVNLPVHLINTAVTGLSYAKWQEGYSRFQAVERAELMLDAVDFILWLYDLSLAGRAEASAHVMRGPVAAAMYLTWIKDRKDANEFWSAVRDETGISPELPDRKLARYLLTTTINVGHGTQGNRKGTQREFYVKCLHAWNAWRKRGPTDLKYYPEAKLPPVL
jgi:hypothetical protein